MSHDLVLTVISDDKPGVVDTLAQTINRFGGNWLESRMSHLAGKFAGILRVSVNKEQAETLRNALEALAQEGVKVMVECATREDTRASVEYQDFTFSAVGPDRPGIVREIAQALLSRNINMEQLSTDYSSTPWSGDPLFIASGTLRVPKLVDVDELNDQFETIADELALDIKLEAASATEQ
ncbi:MAG: ACT domain-containing protein [Exilibacterium sp.]